MNHKNTDEPYVSLKPGEKTVDGDMVQFSNGNFTPALPGFIVTASDDFKVLRLLASPEAGFGTPAVLPTMPEEPAARKALPVATGVIDYFPDALLAVADCSRAGNEQHHPGQPLHWDRSKSTDQADSLIRHFIQRGTLDTDGIPHSAKVAWRALAMLQLELERKAASRHPPERRGNDIIDDE